MTTRWLRARPADLNDPVSIGLLPPRGRGTGGLPTFAHVLEGPFVTTVWEKILCASIVRGVLSLRLLHKNGHLARVDDNFAPLPCGERGEGE